MHIHSLKLKNFRNFEDGELTIGDGTTVLYGGVGEGKTNLIEAIFMLSVGRSYRTPETKQVIRWGNSEAYVRGVGENSGGSLAVAIKIAKEGKKIELNGENNKKSIELIGGIRSVIFHSEDLGIVGGPPHLRRRFLDLAISQSSKNYTYNLRDYYRVMKQRNSALQTYSQANTSEWDDQLSALGSWITRVRANIISEIGATADKIMRSLVGENTKLELTYAPSGDEASTKFRMKLARTFKHDAARGTTSVGPHRDDFKIQLSGIDARHYASSGERKTIVLALKLAEVEFMRAVTGEKPILLLDDIFSSLDIKRSRALISVTGDGSQCVITLTDLNLLRDEFRSGAKLFEVSEGKIKQAI